MGCPLADGVLFGLGWALTGGCPAAPLVQLGEGKLAALATMVGIAVGTTVYRRVHSATSTSIADPAPASRSLTDFG